MKHIIIFFVFGIVFGLFPSEASAQLAFKGPDSPVASGSIVTFTVTGEYSRQNPLEKKEVVSVPSSGEMSYAPGQHPGVYCVLWNTNYFSNNNTAGRFQYKLTNESTSPKTVEITFRDCNIYTYDEANKGRTTVQTFKCTVTVNPAAPDLSNSISINSVNKVETILFGVDCGFAHAYGTPFNPTGHMERDVWKFAYDINYSKLISSVNDADIYWEWVVSDNSTNFPAQKQFLIYPYGTSKTTPQSGTKKVTVEANDAMDEYDSKVTVRAKSRATGARYSPDYTFYFTAVGH
ncbi:hypothetical protein PBAL39_07011 [Pedobacter sp. BAL39]|uniref:hypothetical protein n=1 Tax=Pedobacter sp. BAL39 TaxID=391596 RepID=UPI000155A065|nr:hypothetical protein [Pedobacter sp. BAL39]EDM35910.1 hypothetical protein PBAL39_07011 [Pedobacter sp. BAL39]